MCTTDDNGNLCFSQMPPPPSDVKNNIAYTQDGALQPNMSTIAANNILFLFLNPADFSSANCTSCIRKVFQTYTNAETASPYGPGLDKSPSLSGQQPLYNAIQSTCGPNFLNSAVQAAGSLSGGSGSSSSSAGITTVADFKVVALALGITTILASFN